MYRNLGLSPLCTFGEKQQLNPPIWGSSVRTEYELLNGGKVPSYVTDVAEDSTRMDLNRDEEPFFQV